LRCHQVDDIVPDGKFSAADAYRARLDFDVLDAEDLLERADE
jgi:hypothetical protein